MGLPITVDTLDAVPEPLREHYTRTPDGKFTLPVDGTPPGFVPSEQYNTEKAAHAEFRDRNVGMLKEIASMLGIEKVETLDPLRQKLDAMKGIDLAEYARLKASAEDLAKRGITKGEDLREMLGAALADLRATEIEPMKRELQETKAQRDAAKAENERARARVAMTDAFVQAGGLPAAAEFMFAQFEQDFQILDGKIEAKPGRYSNVHGGQPLTVDEWMAGQMKKNDFAFKTSGGSAANPGGSSARSPHTGPIRSRDGSVVNMDGITALS